MAAATGAQLLGLSSLDVLAFRASTGRRIIWPVVDVRRNEVATAPYRPVPGGVIREGAPEVVSPKGFAALLDSTADDTLVVGDYEALPAGALRGLHRVKVGRPRWPSADVLLELARARMAKGDRAGPRRRATALPAGPGRHHQLEGLSGRGGMDGLMIIRPLHEADLDAVIEVEAASFVEPWSRSLFAEEIAQPTRRYDCRHR